ncbi:uncharacterized protein [Typha angustifolia]|uniref:uncharacterized protein n=1 Tax=Typha angustifolia TaxID=59011 RepID=UPI003C2C8D0E
MGFGAALATRRPFAVTAATKKVGGLTQKEEEKGPFDWILGALQKEDQLLETDPILKKVEETNGRKSTTSVSVPPKKSGGFGGLFAQK